MRKAFAAMVTVGAIASTFGLSVVPSYADVQITGTNTNTWVVQSGDSLWKISQATGASVSSIVSLNEISNPNLIVVGQVLELPMTTKLKQKDVIHTAEQYLGVPYQWGGESPSGFDCSGLVQLTFAQNSISLPRVSRDQYTVGTPVAQSQLQMGDLVFFTDSATSGVTHVGIYISNGQFINSDSKGVSITTLSNPYWAAHYYGAKRVIS